MESGGGREAVVVGGGLVGTASALALSSAGFAVRLCDLGHETAASMGNAGHVAVEQCDPLAAPGAIMGAPARLHAFGGPIDFRLRDADLWAPWAARFALACRRRVFEVGRAALSGLCHEAIPAWRRSLTAAGAPELLRERGHWLVWESEATARRGRRAWRKAATGPAVIAPLSVEARDEIGDRLRVSIADGLSFSGTAAVTDPLEVLSALRAAFVRRGGVVVSARAAVSRVGDRVKVEAGGERLIPDLVVLAAGVGSRPLMAALGLSAPLIAERGYHVQAPVQPWGAAARHVVLEDRSLIIAPLTSGLRASSYVEFGRAAAAPDPSKHRRLLRAVSELGLEGIGPWRLWTGPRPTLPDYRPAIGRPRALSNLVCAFGHQHLGLTLAAVTAEAVADLALERPRPDLWPFSPDRFL